LVFFMVLAVAAPLRFVNLGYSDYIKDENNTLFDAKAQRIYSSFSSFLIHQRKGPLQYVTTYVVYLLTHDLTNELAERLPFAVANLLAVGMFYLLVVKLTKSRVKGLIAAALFMVNGFIVGFGRIAQYQNLNLLFSFLSLYFYLDLEKRPLKGSLLGTLFFALSLLAHWDAIFILPPVIILFGKFLKDPAHVKTLKFKVILLNLLLGALILLPFLIPYITEQSGNSDNMRYLHRRLNIFGQAEFGYKTIIELYNPFVTLYFLLAAGVAGAVFIKKSWMYVLWFAVDFIFFVVLFFKPGTHIYNFLIPAIILCAVGIDELRHRFPKYSKVILGVTAALLVFFYYQSYMIFVDNRAEFPWTQETILGLKTQDYTGRVYNLPLFGFPLNRHWVEINKFVNEQNLKNGTSLSYVTNEDAAISNFYMDTEYNLDSQFYFIGIKRPLSFVNDWSPKKYGHKTLLTSLSNNGETVVRIYKIVAD
jgi:4-amino-4-deoxy-L-arabinose transferase-like glycosyltransferase